MIWSWLVTIGAVLTLVSAWWVPSTVECALLGWTSALLWCAALVAPQQRVRRLYAAGVLTYCGGFYWLFSTISDFGGFPAPAAAAVFALFAFGSAIQFAFWAFIWERLPNALGRWGLRMPLAWLVAHRFWIKIFPWDFGHTQVAFVPFAQLAGLGGVTLVTFALLWIADVAANLRTAAAGARILAAVAMVSAVGYGLYVQETLPEHLGTGLKTVLVQGNVSLEHKHNITYFTVNREHYVEISKKISEPDTLIVWPESTITEFIPAHARDARFVPLLPYIGDGSAFLVGGLTYLSREEYFNSSLLIRPDGSIAEPYHKIILMPFGEYTPMSSWFPWLKEVNSTAGNFTAGKAPGVLSFLLRSGGEVRLSPLICYEDIIPSLARGSVLQGAELLINQTNDAWFGDSAAPYQHHMIASFRAIENRRYLLRSTNTGVTAVVDPLGRTLASLPTYTEATLPMEVHLISSNTWYTALPVENVWLLIAALTVFVSVADIRRQRGRT